METEMSDQPSRGRDWWGEQAAEELATIGEKFADAWADKPSHIPDSLFSGDLDAPYLCGYCTDNFVHLNKLRLHLLGHLRSATPIRHGTRWGYRQHHNHGEDACDACRTANTEWVREWRKRKAEQPSLF